MGGLRCGDRAVFSEKPGRRGLVLHGVWLRVGCRFDLESEGGAAEVRVREACG